MSKSNKKSDTKHSFKNYYDNNEEFRKKHIKKMNEKIFCECGFETARSNLYRHKKGSIHTQNMEKISGNKEETLKKLLSLKKHIDSSIKNLVN
jgi:1,2-phenylacetyl-CoA epoxidase catalytic subunit